MLLVVTAFVAGTGYLLLRPSHIQATAVDALEKLTRADVTLDFAQLTWDGELILEGVDVRVPNVAGPAGRLLQADRVVVRPEWLSMIWGEPTIRWVDADRLQIFITENRDAGKYVVNDWLKQFENQEAGPPIHHLPEVTLDQTVVVFSYLENGHVTVIDQFTLDASLVPDIGSDSSYLFRVDTDDLAAPLEQPDIAGSIDLNDGTIAAKLTNFKFNRDTERLLPQELRKWWYEHNPQGRIVSLEVLMTSAGEDERTATAVLKFDRAAVTLPMGNLEPRLQNVEGQLRLMNATLIVDELQGDVASIGYRVNGRIDDIRKPTESPLNVTVTTSVFEIPENLRELVALPDAVLEHYERLSPSGTYSVQTAFIRDEPDGPMRHSTLINLVDVRMVYHGFQYPISNVTGRVLIEDKKVTIQEFKGVGPSGANVNAYGTINPAGKKAEVNIEITADEVPVDQHLRDALNPQRLKLLNEFFNQPQYERLLQAGVIRRADQYESDMPIFEIGGKTKLKISLHRPEGLDKQYRNHITVDTAGMSAVMEHWPYPATSTAGEVLITPDGTIIRDVSLVGPTGAKAVVSGKIPKQASDGERATDVHVDVERFPIDYLLLATLPPQQAQWIRKLGFSGAIETHANLFRERAGDPLDFIAKGQVLEGSIRPFNQQLNIENVQGNIELTPKQLKLTDLTANHANMKLQGDALIQWVDQKPKVQAAVAFRQVVFDPVLLDLMPPDLPEKQRILKLVRDHRLRGNFNAEAKLDLDHNALRYKLDVSPSQVNLIYRDEPVAVTQMKGKISFASNSIQLHQLAGRLGEMTLNADGLILPGEETAASLTIGAKADRIDKFTRLFLPKQALNTIDKLAFNTSYEFHQAQLHWNSPELGKPGMRFQGDINFENAKGVIAVPFREGAGKFAVNFTKFKDQAYPDLNLNLNANTVLVKDRQLRNLNIQVDSTDDLKTLNFERIRASMYNGTLTGKGKIGIASPQQYVFELAVQNAELGPVLNPESASPNDANSNEDKPIARNVDSGLISTSLSIMGRTDQPDGLRGRGQLDITRAQLFKQPLALTLLHTVNLAMPVSDSFENVTAAYTLEGNTVHIQSLTFASQFAAISGGGTIQFPAGQLDLAMVARNPSGPNLGAIADMIHLVKDEVVGIRVDGTLQKPQARIVSFEGVLSTWRRLFPDLFKNR